MYTILVNIFSSSQNKLLHILALVSKIENSSSSDRSFHYPIVFRKWEKGWKKKTKTQALQSFYFPQQDSPHAGNQTHGQVPPCVQGLQCQGSVLTPSHPRFPARCGRAAAPRPGGSPAGCAPRVGAPRSLGSRLPAALPAAAALQSRPCPSRLQVSLKTHRNLQGKRENSCSAKNSFYTCGVTDRPARAGLLEQGTLSILPRH